MVEARRASAATLRIAGAITDGVEGMSDLGIESVLERKSSDVLSTLSYILRGVLRCLSDSNALRQI